MMDATARREFAAGLAEPALARRGFLTRGAAALGIGALGAAGSLPRLKA